MLRQIEFENATDLSDQRLLALCRDGAAAWSTGRIKVRVRYSRGADFSGTCFYIEKRILINLGRHLVYPYQMGTHLARAKTAGRTWYKPIYNVELKSGYEVVLFVFMHELYHLLVRKARRNPRQKESMCDRFAARYLVDRFRAPVRDEDGRPVPRDDWDFQDLDGFVAAARRRRPGRHPALGRGKPGIPAPAEQLLLFPV